MGLTFKIKKETNGAVLHISGNVTVKHCIELRETLLTYLSTKNLNEISLAEVESLDIAGLQLFYLLKEEYKAAKRKLTFVAPKNEEIADIINRSGMLTILESND